MRISLVAGILALFTIIPAGASPVPAVPPGAQPSLKPNCIDPRDSADYVPGVGANGRAVPPADLPGGAQVQVSTEVYPVLKSANPQIGGVGVIANLPGLENRPPCPSPASPGTAASRR